MKISKTFIKFILAIATFIPMLNAASITFMLYSKAFGWPFAGQEVVALFKHVGVIISLATLYTYGICKVLFMAVDRIQE
jgi:hypothetical protein